MHLLGGGPRRQQPGRFHCHAGHHGPAECLFEPDLKVFRVQIIERHIEKKLVTAVMLNKL